jgi:hypothetical protein
MVINLSIIKQLLDDKNSNINTWNVDLDQYGNPEVSGSIEFELSDSDGRLWGGRFIEKDGQHELVEFFPKIFFSDTSYDDLIAPGMNINPSQITSQDFDEFSDYIE